MKKLTVLAGGLAVAALLWGLSGSAWGRSGRFPLIRKALQTANLPGEEEGTYRLFLDVPPADKSLAEIVAPRDVFNVLAGDDVIEIRIRALPFVGIQAVDYGALRSGAVVVRWNEGYPFLYGAIGVAGLAGGLVLLGIARLAANLLRVGAPPEG